MKKEEKSGKVGSGLAREKKKKILENRIIERSVGKVAKNSNWLKWIVITVIIFVIILVGIILFLNWSKDEIKAITKNVERSTLTQSVDATGELKSIADIELSFGSSGTLSELLVEIGDEVVLGQILAQLDSGELEANVEKAQQAVQIARANLLQKQAGSTSEAINVAEASVQIAEAAYESAKIDLINSETDLENAKLVGVSSVAQAEVELTGAKDNLENVLANSQQNLLEQHQDLISTFGSNLIAVRSTLSDADEIIGVDNSLANNNYQNFLSALDFQALISAENAYRRAKLSRDKAEVTVYDLAINPSESEILATANIVVLALSDTATTLLETRRALDATSVDASNFSFADLSSLKSGIDLARNSVQQEQELLKTELQNFDSLKITNKKAEDLAQNKLSAAKEGLDRAKADRQDRISGAEAAVRSVNSRITIRAADVLKAKATLQQIKVGPRYIDIAALEAEVHRTEAALVIAEERLNDVTLKSPIDGIVTEIVPDVGEDIVATKSAMTIQTSGEGFYVVVDVPEADITKIALGDFVETTFDAFTDDIITNGKVESIDPAEKEIEGVIFYEVSVSLDTNSQPSGLKPGMSVDVTIITETAESALVVPQRSILTSDGKKIIRIRKNGKIEERVVELGLRGDGGQIQIISGVKEGEEVVVRILDE